MSNVKTRNLEEPGRERVERVIEMCVFLKNKNVSKCSLYTFLH